MLLFNLFISLIFLLKNSIDGLCKEYLLSFYDSKETIKEQARIRYNNLSLEQKQKRNGYAKNRYNNLSEDKKNEKRAYGKNRYHNISSEQLQKYKEYQKNYQKIYRAKKKSRVTK